MVVVIGSWDGAGDGGRGEPCKGESVEGTLGRGTGEAGEPSPGAVGKWVYFVVLGISLSLISALLCQQPKQGASGLTLRCGGAVAGLSKR